MIIMFDNLNISKAYKITDNLTGNNVEIAQFNAYLTRGSNITINMNVNYPNLYEIHREAILQAYREFNSNVTALAVSMGLAEEITESPTILQDTTKLMDAIKLITSEVLVSAMSTISNIDVNEVPELRR